MATLRTLFSGGELFGCGALAAGYTHLDGFEIDLRIAAVAQQNGFRVHTADVRQVDYGALERVDHLHASPSCKTASNANNDGGETIEDLECAEATARAIAAHQGRTFSLENVWAYRNFESFLIILSALHRAGFIYDFAHVNAADFGVPQTRKRLILRAVRGANVPLLVPTHRRGGDLYRAGWVGWYAAIADLIPALPSTEPALWQRARLPRYLQTALFHSGISRDHDGNEYEQQHRPPAEPAYTISTMSPGWYKAYIVGGGNTQLAQIDSYARPAHEPMFTVSAGDGTKKAAAAWLVDGANGNAISGVPTLRVGTDPAFTIVPGNSRRVYRGLIAGRWVRMTIEALGCFQTVPPSYRGLTSVINGNGVPCLLAQRILESFREVAL